MAAAPKERPTCIMLSPNLYTFGTAIGDGRVLIEETDKGKIAKLKTYPEFRDIFVYEIEEKGKKNGGNMKKRPGKLDNTPAHEIILRAAMDKKSQFGTPIVLRKQPTASSSAQEQPTAPTAPSAAPQNQPSAPLPISTPQETSRTFWKKPNFYLIFLAPIYVPVITYFFSPVFDSIIFKFKEIVM